MTEREAVDDLHLVVDLTHDVSVAIARVSARAHDWEVDQVADELLAEWRATGLRNPTRAEAEVVAARIVAEHRRTC